jgi:tRNA 2-thiouridine synthesizing protein E
MPQITVNDRTLELSEAGWLEDSRQWDEDVARVIAEREQVSLSGEHWDAIRTACTYFDEYGIVPEQRVFMKLMKDKFGPERSSQQYLYSLFPYGQLKQGNKIAGLPRPKGCS